MHVRGAFRARRDPRRRMLRTFMVCSSVDQFEALETLSGLMKRTEATVLGLQQLRDYGARAPGGNWLKPHRRSWRGTWQRL